MTILYDSNAIYARSFYAAQTASRAGDVWPGYFLKALFGVIHACGRPQTHLFCWDGAQAKTVKPRDDKPDAYYALMGAAREMIETIFGREACYQSDEHESDDLVATAAIRAASRPGADVVVVSGDKDLTALAGPGVRYYCLNKKRFLATVEISARWGVHRPSQVAVALAVIGDKGDGVDGVHGLGRKAVEKLFRTLPPSACLAEAVDHVAANLSPAQRDQFYTSFGQVLLKTELTVPEPVAFDLIEPGSLDTAWRDEYEQLVCLDDPLAMERRLARLEDRLERFDKLDV